MEGYFGIGIYQPRKEENIGTLLRSAYQLGASFVCIVEGNYKIMGSDVFKTHLHIPLFRFTSFAELRASLYDCVPVGIEFGEHTEPLAAFRHPERCVYLLGNEVNGLSKEILSGVKHTVCIESVRKQSYNVAMAGTIVMYHRLLQRLPAV